METSEILQKVRKIEIKTRGLSKHIFSGQYHSAFKGRGMTFSEVREYQYGDDIRFIDWNVTARFGHPYVKVFEEERELTFMLLIDVSASNDFGSTVRNKKDMITEIAATLAFSAIENNDKVGVIFFSSKIEKFIPPKKGRTHILRIIREMIDFTPQEKGTSISEALRFFKNVQKRKCTAFLISDFLDDSYEDALKIVAKEHDLNAIVINDTLEQAVPNVGIVRFYDNETGKTFTVDTSSKYNRDLYATAFAEREEYAHKVFMKYGMRHTSIATKEDYVKPLISLFSR
ncbi:MAG: DUF58 domain-containing protein [Bacteroidales bacterium]|jgi:uncharacterized protein (DUF58 family)|nr:DUF58 domain-containing protein [Bacteroidales bacterium]